MEKIAKAGPVLLYLEESPKGVVLQLNLMYRGVSVKHFSLYLKHVLDCPDALALLEEFIARAKELKGSSDRSA